MKKIICLFMAIAFSGAMMAQEGLKVKKVTSPVAELVDALDQKVKLSDVQKKNAHKIYTKFVKENESASVLFGEPKKMAMKAAQEKVDKALQAILTEEQRKALEGKKEKSAF